MKKYRINIMLKDGVRDNQGNAVQHILLSGHFGFEKVQNVRVGRIIEVEVEDEVDSDQLKDIALSVTNTIIEKYTIEEVNG